MNSNQLMSAIVMANSTPLMQIKSGLRHASDPDRIEIDLTEQVFRLPKKKRTMKELEKEITALFIKKLGVKRTIYAVLSGLMDNDGPIDGIAKSIITKACWLMGYRNPVS